MISGAARPSSGLDLELDFDGAERQPHPASLYCLFLFLPLEAALPPR